MTRDDKNLFSRRFGNNLTSLGIYGPGSKAEQAHNTLDIMTYEDVKTESGADHGLLTPNNIYTPQRLDLKGNPGRSKFE